ncbi:hypothetical protein PO002_31165 [Cupriavidus necator]|uniref:hypothetical protein n=1 Tax=Cupriavidus necator TaxID=106590 RepID=UPI0039C32B25
MDAHFYAVAYEKGFDDEPLPIWTDRPCTVDPFDLSGHKVVRLNIPEVPGAFQLLNVLSTEEADNLVRLAEELGFGEDSPVSLPHSIRHNKNVNWVVSERIDGTLWQRSKSLVTEEIRGEGAKGINARFRFYRYDTGDFFKPHSDGAWLGSRVVNGELVADAYPGRVSQYTYLIFLNDGYEGGRTQFLVSRANPCRPAKHEDDVNVVPISTPKGAVLCFPHGFHPLHCMHSSESIRSGVKYVIRTDILF